MTMDDEIVAIVCDIAEGLRPGESVIANIGENETLKISEPGFMRAIEGVKFIRPDGPEERSYEHEKRS